MAGRFFAGLRPPPLLSPRPLSRRVSNTLASHDAPLPSLRLPCLCYLPPIVLRPPSLLLLSLPGDERAEEEEERDGEEVLVLAWPGLAQKERNRGSLWPGREDEETKPRRSKTGPSELVVAVLISFLCTFIL